MNTTRGMKRLVRSTVAGLLGTVALATVAHAGAFTPGNIVVYRVGDGSQTLVRTGNSVFLDEYTASGSFVQTVALPCAATTVTGCATTASGSNKPLIAIGESHGVSEGLLTRSSDGQYLVLTGYDRNYGVSGNLDSTTAATVPRVVGRVQYDGSIDTTTALTDMSSANNVRSATSTDGSVFWVAGASSSSGGVHYVSAPGNTTSTTLALTPTGDRQVLIFSGQLYVDSNTATNLNVNTVGTGLPTSGTPTVTKLTSLPDLSGPEAFFFASMGGGTVLYVADNTAGTISKYSLVSGSWSSNGSITVTSAHGITGIVGGDGSTVTVFVTSTAGTDGKLNIFTDSSGFNATVSGTVTTPVTLPANEAFRGIALAPALQCTQPTDPSNGTYASCNPTVSGGTCVLTCDAGYTKDGDATCTGGSWSTQTCIANPTATAVPATATPVPATDTPLGATATPVPATDTPIPPTSTATQPTATATQPTSTPTATATFTPGPFTAGNIVVYRVGDGSATLTNNGNAVFLDEYTTSGTLVQSIALPTTANGSQNPLIAQGSTGSGSAIEGLIADSTNGQYVLLTGYDTTLGGSSVLSSTACGTVPRTVGRVKYDGTVDTTTALSDFSCASNPRSATSTDGTNIWVGGNAGGARYTTLGSSTSTQVSASVTNIRQVNIFGGQLYGANGSTNVSTVGTGEPTTSATVTTLPGLSTGSPDGFFFASLPGGTVLYVADDAAGSIQKYSLVSGNWSANGSITLSSARGVFGIVSGANVQLFLTNATSTLNTCTDTAGYNATVSGCTTLTALVSGNAKKIYHGVAAAPVNPCAGAADGTACDDGNPCTGSDTCQSGVCTGTALTCTASDQCHVAGVCDTTTGLCSNPAAVDGTTCDDGDACTQTDSCQAGSCVGSNPVVCTALDQCHSAGTCDTGTGLCSNPAKTDSTPCDDGDACTTNDSCQSGVCTGGPALVCDTCQTCDSSLGCTGAVCTQTPTVATNTPVPATNTPVPPTGTVTNTIAVATNTVAPTVTGTPQATGTKTATPPASPTPTRTPTPIPNLRLAQCENAVGVYLYRLGGCLMACQVRQATLGLRSVSFDEAGCETTCRATYNKLTGALLAVKKPICPTCLQQSQVTALADSVSALVHQNNAQVYCSGATALSGGGVQPPDIATARCEEAIAARLYALQTCDTTCQVRQTVYDLRNLTGFDELACEQGPGTTKPLSCRGSYNAVSSALLGMKKPICPACLNATAQSSVADAVAALVQQNKSQIYCAFQ